MDLTHSAHAEIMMNQITEFKKEDRRIRIYYDEDPQSPREWDNLGTMVCNHPNYTLGDKTWTDSFESYCDSQDLESKITSQDETKDLLFLPLYLLDHSGITMSTGHFVSDSQGWDTSLVGIIYVSKARVKEEYNVKRISRKLKSRVLEYLRNEVKTYASYLEGNVYGFESDNGLETDSCWGYFSIEDIKTELGIDQSWNENES